MSTEENFESFAEALGESLDEIKPIASEDSADGLIRSQRRNNELLAKALKRAALELTDVHDNNPLSATLRHAVKPDDMLCFKRSGIQEGVFKNLRLGKYALEGVIDLRQMRMEDVRKRLYSDVLRLHKQGVRAVLVKHGRGEQSKPVPALCKSYVNQWLEELGEVIAYHSAQPQHGGLGSTYVLLKKHADQKQLNRERLQKRY
ncbi:DNA endonuclease SmrA [Alteromonas facilis]|uniref:DNA endonuclease SmrA n=1 Tax=Alteromonas facilis TaxID=2048004 RepID=UPI000C294103|nr:DNA endonuclease SmrA [Alteromonas facilis]